MPESEIFFRGKGNLLTPKNRGKSIFMSLPPSESVNFADTKPHYELLDGLRGVAALLVLVYHIFEGFAFAKDVNGEGSITGTLRWISFSFFPVSLSAMPMMTAGTK